MSKKQLLLIATVVVAVAALLTYAVFFTKVFDDFNPDEGLAGIDPASLSGTVISIEGTVEGVSTGGSSLEPWLGRLEVLTSGGKVISVPFNAKSRLDIPAVSKIETLPPGMSLDFPYHVVGLRFEGQTKTVRTHLFGLYRQPFLVQGKFIHPGSQ